MLPELDISSQLIAAKSTIDQLTKQRDDALDKLSAYEESIRFTIGTLKSLME